MAPEPPCVHYKPVRPVHLSEPRLVIKDALKKERICGVLSHFITRHQYISDGGLQRAQSVCSYCNVKSKNEITRLLQNHIIIIRIHSFQ